MERATLRRAPASTDWLLAFPKLVVRNRRIVLTLIKRRGRSTGERPVMARALAVPAAPDCRRCGQIMQETGRIAPFADDPGLRLFECSACGAATSRLEPSRPGRRWNTSAPDAK